MADGTRSILVKLRGGDVKKISGIPANAKVTFGKVNPATDGRFAGDANPYALRIYTSQNNQLAVFLNVVEFRDESLKVTSRHTTVETEGEEKRDGDGRVVKSRRNAKATDEWKEETW